MNTSAQGPTNQPTQRYYETRYTENEARDRIWRDITQFLLPYWQLPSGAKVLELGAGYGSWIRAIPAGEKHALDLHSGIGALFKERGITDVQTHVGSCTRLESFASSSLDLVLASNLLEHLTIEDAIETANEVFRVLKPGGLFCTIQPNFRLCFREYFDDYTHRTIFTESSLMDLLRSSGLETQKAWSRFLPFSMKGGGAKLSFLVPFYLRSPWKPRAGQLCIIAKRGQYHVGQ